MKLSHIMYFGWHLIIDQHTKCTDVYWLTSHYWSAYKMYWCLLADISILISRHIVLMSFGHHVRLTSQYWSADKMYGCLLADISLLINTHNVQMLLADISILISIHNVLMSIGWHFNIELTWINVLMSFGHHVMLTSHYW